MVKIAQPVLSALAEGKLRERMIAMGWDGRRITDAVSEIHRAGIARVISAGDRSLLDELLRTKLGPEFQLPLR